MHHDKRSLGIYKMQAALDIQKNVDIMQHKTNEIMTDGSVIWAAWLLVLILGGGGGGPKGTWGGVHFKTLA
jgi:hypothetical protein